MYWLKKMIDKYNEIILKMLLKEARTPIKEIAKISGLSSPSVYLRINHLRKSGVINGSITQIDPSKLGYNCCGFLEIQTRSENENEIRKYLRNKRCTIYDYEHFGKSNICAHFALPSLDNLAKLIETIRQQPLVRNVKPTIWNNLTQLDHSQNLVFSTIENSKRINSNINSSKKIGSNNKEKNNEKKRKWLNSFRLGRTDIEIAKILLNDAKIPFSNIAKKLKLSPNSVIRSYRKLKKEEILSYSTITINLEKIGYKAMAIFYLKASQISSGSKLYNKFIQTPNVIVAIKIIGPYDVVINVPIVTFSELLELKEKILKAPEIEQMSLEIHGPVKKWPLNVFAALLDKYQIPT